MRKKKDHPPAHGIPIAIPFTGFSVLCRMKMVLASVNSGSNGNCYYVGNEHDAVLVDAGLSCRETERRLRGMGLPMTRVRAVFVSHEHTDHIKGVAALSRKHRLPVYISAPTYLSGRPDIDTELLRPLAGGMEVTAGSLTVQSFVKRHDAAEPHSLTVSSDGLTVGVFTDIGSACDDLVSHFGRCHAAFLEANYDEGMLDRGRYPLHLKRRIRGPEGHLSNRQALELFLNHRHPAMQLLILSHLSAENNHPQLVRNLFEGAANGTRIEVASRFEAGEVFEVVG